MTELRADAKSPWFQRAHHVHFHWGMRALFLSLTLLACGPDCPTSASSPRAGATIQANVALDVGMQHESFACSGNLVPGAPKGTPGQAHLSCTQPGGGQLDLTWSVAELSDVSVGNHVSGGLSFDNHVYGAMCSGSIDATVTLEVKSRTGGPNPQPATNANQSAVTADYALDATYHVDVPAQMLQPCSIAAFSFDVPVKLTPSAFEAESVCY